MIMHRIRAMAVALLVASSAVVTTSPAVAGSPPPVGTLSSTHIAAAIHGNIVLFRADGGGRQQLTSGGLDSYPVTSPDGRRVAFLRAPRLEHQDFSPRRRDVMVAEPDGANRYQILRFASRSPVAPLSRTALAWQPGAHAPSLAWFDANSVMYRRSSGVQYPLLKLDPAFAAHPYELSLPLAWSPDGSQLATAFAVPPGGTVSPRGLRIVVGSGTRHQHSVTAFFRPGVLGNQTSFRSSSPVPGGLAISQDGRHLLFATQGGGPGYRLTGVFQVPLTGGFAQIILGNENALRERPPFSPALDNATRFQLSPDRRYMATDPNNHFWISGAATSPHIISVLKPSSCVVSQWTWLPNSSGLAYVTACTIPGNQPLYRLTLSTVSVNGGSPHVLRRLDARDQQAIDLAPSYRCVACGG